MLRPTTCHVVTNWLEKNTYQELNTHSAVRHINHSITFVSFATLTTTRDEMQQNVARFVNSQSKQT